MYDEDGIIEEENSEENEESENSGKTKAEIFFEEHPYMNNLSNLTPEERKIYSEKALETRRKNREAKKEQLRQEKEAKDSIRYLLNLRPTNEVNEKMAEMGIAEEERTNMMAIILKQFTMAMKGNIKSFENLMKYAGFEPGESRKDKESEVRIAAIQGGQAGSLSSGEDGNDVMIYLPAIEEVSDVDGGNSSIESNIDTINEGGNENGD